MNAKVGTLIIDEQNRRFKIDPSFSPKGEAIAPLKIARGMMGFATMGTSLIAEKAIKSVANSVSSLSGAGWYDFSDLIGYSVNMSNERQYSSVGGNVKLAKGLWIGERKGTSKKVTTACSIILKLNNLRQPTVTIQISNKPLNAKDSARASKLLQDTIAALDLIKRN